MRIATAQKVQDDACAKLTRIYSDARAWKWSHATLLLNRARVWSDIKGAPYYRRQYVMGYDQALRDQLYRSGDYIFGAWINGEFYSHDRDRADSVDARGLSYADFSALLKTPGARTGHYWRTNPTYVFSETIATPAEGEQS